MSTDPVEPLRPSEPVAIEGERLVIRDLAVDGAALAAAQQAVAEGRDLELVVRQMLEVGGAVLLHGAGKATVDAVGSEVDRLLALLTEKADTAWRLRRVREKTSFRGLDYEGQLAPVLDRAFEPHGDTLEHLGGTPVSPARRRATSWPASTRRPPADVRAVSSSRLRSSP